MMKCQYCGKDLPDGTRFCIYCGRKLTADPSEEEDLVMPEQEAEVPSDPVSVEEETAGSEAEDTRENTQEEEIPAEEKQSHKTSFKEECRHMLDLIRHPFTSQYELNGLIIPASIFIHGFYLYELAAGLFYEYLKSLYDAVGAYVMNLYGFQSLSHPDISGILNQYGFTYGDCLAWGALLSAILLGTCMLAAFFAVPEKDFTHLWQKASTWLFMPELFLLLAALVSCLSYTAGFLFSIFAICFLMIYLIHAVYEGSLPAYAKVLFITAMILLNGSVIVGSTVLNISKIFQNIINVLGASLG
jgi:hypothetical protein